MKSIMIIIDTIANKAPVSAFELISFAKTLALSFSLKIDIIIAGKNIRDIAEKAALSGHDVTGLEHDELSNPNPDFLARAIAAEIDDIKPQFICFQHTIRGCQMAAFVSLQQNISCITAVESFYVACSRPVFRRSLFNSKINIELSPGSDRSVMTILPGSFAEAGRAAPSAAQGNIVIKQLSEISSPVRPLAITESFEETVRIEESDVIISAGRGIGTQENLELVHAVSRLFPNASVGASRIICDQKWLPYAHQVGVTGKTVSPKLYMACGISGAQQHIAGMKNSQLIVSINKDPQAAIFSISDYIIVEDLQVFLPILVQKHEELYK